MDEYEPYGRSDWTDRPDWADWRSLYDYWTDWADRACW